MVALTGVGLESIGERERERERKRERERERERERGLCIYHAALHRSLTGHQCPSHPALPFVCHLL